MLILVCLRVFSSRCMSQSAHGFQPQSGAETKEGELHGGLFILACWGTLLGLYWGYGTGSLLTLLNLSVRNPLLRIQGLFQPQTIENNGINCKYLISSEFLERLIYASFSINFLSTLI